MSDNQNTDNTDNTNDTSHDKITDFTAHAKDIKARLEKAAKYTEKAINLESSAAYMLIQAKAELPHGQYTPWLKRNGIAPRTASRIIAEHLDPKKREARMTKAAQKARSDRAKAAKAEAKAKREAEQAEQDAKNPNRTKMLKIVSGLDAEGVDAVLAFLVAQGYDVTEDTGEKTETDAAQAA